MTGRPDRSASRRGLGRGLGSLIPTGPRGDISEPVAGADEGDRDGRGHRPSDSGAVSSAGAGAGAGASRDGSPSGETAPGLVPVAGTTYAEIPIDAIRPNAQQPRHVFDEDALAELVHSITEIGLLQPVVVRQLTKPADADTPGAEEVGYELVMGERRWRAAQAAGLTRIPAIVRETADTDMLRDALLENLHRAQLNPLEEASAYAQLLEDFGCTHDELATRIGRSRPQISNTLRLLRLSPAVQRRVAAGVLSAGHARSLLGVEDAETQDRLAQRVVAEGISVRGLEEIVAVGDVGAGASPGRRTPRRKPFAPGLVDLSERLSDRLETRVRIDLGKTKGKVVVEFASLDDLRRIVDIMDPRNRRDRPV